MDAVTGVDQDHFVDDLSDLVCLEMADHVELCVLRDLRALLRDLLHLILAVVALSRLIGLHQHGDRLRLADGDQGDLLRISSRAKAGCVHAFPYVLYILCN